MVGFTELTNQFTINQNTILTKSQAIKTVQMLTNKKNGMPIRKERESTQAGFHPCMQLKPTGKQLNYLIST